MGEIDTQTYEEKLLNTSCESKGLAIEYKNARSDYARTYNRISLLIYKAGLTNEKAAFEKIITKLFTHPEYGQEAIKVSQEMNSAEQLYKGLEQVLKAYQAEISAIQSVIKWHQSGEIMEATKQKYMNGGY